MKEPHEYSLQDLLKVIYRNEDMTDALIERQTIDAYYQVVGDLISKLTGKIVLRGGVLHVHLSSAALRQEMTMRKESLLEKINAQHDGLAVKDIVFY